MDRKAVYMRNDVLFINAIIVITLLYSLIQGIQLILYGQYGRESRCRDYKDKIC